MGALGYSRNKMPFLELAGRLPLRLLETAPERFSEGEYLAHTQGLLLGMAGFMEEQATLFRVGFCPDWIISLEKAWAAVSHFDMMSPDDWHFMKVRPYNSPLCRLLALSHLLLRYRRTGLLNGLIGLVNGINGIGEGPSVLETGLTVNHAGFEFAPGGTGAGSPGGAALLGKARATDIAVNILLPFIAAWGRLYSEPKKGRRAVALYRIYPAASMNSVESYMAGRLGISRGELKFARRRQGLIHLYRNCYRSGGCDSCLSGQLQTRSDVHVKPVGFSITETEITAGADHGGIIST
jgi:hypothetical protein